VTCLMNCQAIAKLNGQYLEVQPWAIPHLDYLFCGLGVAIKKNIHLLIQSVNHHPLNQDKIH
jgi:hypothetical protein